MDRREILKKLDQLWDSKSLLEKNGPNSGPGSTWLAEARAHIQLADSALGEEFAHYMSYVGLRLSSHTLGPIWINMQGILRTAIAKLKAECPPPRRRYTHPARPSMSIVTWLSSWPPQLMRFLSPIRMLIKRFSTCTSAKFVSECGRAFSLSSLPGRLELWHPNLRLDQVESSRPVQRPPFMTGLSL